MKSCLNCEVVKTTGKYIPATRRDPEEYPEVECGYDGKLNIEKFHTMFSEYLRATDQTHREDDYIYKAGFCPFYKESIWALK